MYVYMYAVEYVWVQGFSRKKNRGGGGERGVVGMWQLDTNNL